MAKNEDPNDLIGGGPYNEPEQRAERAATAQGWSYAVGAFDNPTKHQHAKSYNSWVELCEKNNIPFEDENGNI